jgi:hypothetical protein
MDPQNPHARTQSTMTLALKLDRARLDLEYWQKIAEDPKLFPAAAQAARNQVRTYQVARRDLRLFPSKAAAAIPRHPHTSRQLVRNHFRYRINV